MDGDRVDTYEFASTNDSWNEWSTKIKTIYLDASTENHSVMLVAAERAGPNVDWLSIGPTLMEPGVIGQVFPGLTDWLLDLGGFMFAIGIELTGR